MPDDRHEDNAQNLTAYPITYIGPETYAKAFPGSGFGVVMDDDGETCYLFATSEDFTEMLDGMLIFDPVSTDPLVKGEKAYIIWNAVEQKAGLYYHGEYQAIIDFANTAACCRIGLPEPDPAGWCKSSHRWDKKMLSGMTFVRLSTEQPPEAN
ncbi:MAG: DUF2251 domain-containing protein [Nitrospirae bacterium]|nr:DUF2251 domain-containing protein [Nitrospirota bacterium]